MKAMRKVINLAEDLKKKSAREPLKILASHIKVKSEVGGSEAIGPEAVGSYQNPGMIFFIQPYPYRLI